MVLLPSWAHAVPSHLHSQLALGLARSLPGSHYPHLISTLVPWQPLVTNPSAEAVREKDAVKFSICFPALPLHGLALCSLPMNTNSYALICSQLL